MRTPLTFVRRSRPSRQELAVAEALLVGDGPSAGPADDYAGVAEILAAFSGPPLPDEQRGEAAALAAYRAAMSPGALPARARRRRVLTIGGVTMSQLLVAGIAAAVPVGGLAAAAYTGSLPASVQRFAHHTVGAPAPHRDGAAPSSAAVVVTSTGASSSPSPKARPSATGPAPKGAAAYGLCAAWSHGGLHASSTAYRDLATAAGGATNIAAFCAKVPHPGPSGTTAPTAAPSSHPVHPSHPTHPTTPAHPSHPVSSPHPSHPAKPTHPVRPSHPVVPAHAPKSSPTPNGNGKG